MSDREFRRGQDFVSRGPQIGSNGEHPKAIRSSDGQSEVPMKCGLLAERVRSEVTQNFRQGRKFQWCVGTSDKVIFAQKKIEFRIQLIWRNSRELLVNL